MSAVLGSVLPDHMDNAAILRGGALGAVAFLLARVATGQTEFAILGALLGPFATGFVSRSSFGHWKEGAVASVVAVAVAGLLLGFLIPFFVLVVGAGPATLATVLVFASIALVLLPICAGLGTVAGHLGSRARAVTEGARNQFFGDRE